jgi:sarcosine oxidase subunit alpha
VFEDNLIVATQPNCAWRLRAEQIIYSTGARELPAVFTGNDLPGVMLVSAALRLAFLYDLACGKRAVILASCSADADAARALTNYGVSITAILNLAAKDAPWAAQLTADGFDVRHNVTVFTATGTQSVSGANAIIDGTQEKFSCDCVLMNAGSIPASELPAAIGITFPYDDVLCRPVIEHAALAGAVHNRPSLSAAIADGAEAMNGGTRPPADTTPSPASAVLWDGKGKAFVDFDEDLQPRDLDDAIDEGFDDIQLLKRYTTAGMGPAQGKLTNIHAARHLAQRLNCAVSMVGQVTARPPAAAETLAQLAGEEHPIKRTVLHGQHTHLSAQFMPASAWLRPAYYIGAEKESLAVRQHIGMIDISTLGKMQITGPDAAVLLERLYTGKFQKQAVGAVRYALMLDESGIITDDGVVARLDEERFWVTTTTGNADAIYRQMLLWCARWQLRVDVVNMTSAYAAINLAGPEAPPLLEKIAGQSININYMKTAEINLQGIPAILLRVGFVGEKGYEIHLPMGHMRNLWKELLPHAQPFGVEAQRLLRLEKGHVIVGQDTDGLTTPLEADMAWSLGRDKDFYLGQRALEIHRQRGIHRQLRGFTITACWRNRLNEADLVLDDKGHAVGHVTSVSYSPTLDCMVGLAYASPQTPRDSGDLRIRTASGEIMQAQVRLLPFYDPKGERQQ